MKPSTTKVTRETIVVDSETGEVKSTQRESIVQKEPDYVKLYLADLAMINDIPKWVTGILFELIKRMNYENEIILNSVIKKRIATELGIVTQTIDNALGTFVKKQILVRVGVGVYLANPYLFGKGDWNGIRKIRLTIGYSERGKEISAKIEKFENELVEQ